MKRKITIDLTEAQYHALAAAVAIAEEDLADMNQDTRTLLRAWSQINHAWHDRQR